MTIIRATVFYPSTTTPATVFHVGNALPPDKRIIRKMTYHSETNSLVFYGDNDKTIGMICNLPCYLVYDDK